MTRLAILADIHGNSPALEAVLEALPEVDQVIIAGDAVNWGPESVEVLRRIEQERFPMVRGNHELMLLDYGTSRAPAAWKDPIGFSALKFWATQTTSMRAFMACLPDQLVLKFPDAPPLLVCHGSPRSAFETMYADTSEEEMQDCLQNVSARHVVAGHTHQQMLRQVGNHQVVTVGTVGNPVDGNKQASFALLRGSKKGWKAEFRSVAYDHALFLQGFHTSGFLETCGPVGELVYMGMCLSRPVLGDFFSWKSHHASELPISDRLLQSFVLQYPHAVQLQHHSSILTL